METLIFLPMFVAGFGCGFYLRNWLLKQEASQYRPNPNLGPAIATPYRAPDHNQKTVVTPRQTTDHLGPKAIAPLRPVYTAKMNDELRELLNLLPPDHARKA
jgi:hypothetical protein